jgi:ubiquinone/menaquinone biosynthesis C-methylase UbiE
MLEVARRKLGKRADLRLEDASQMSFASGTFDLVMIALALKLFVLMMKIGAGGS